MRVRELEEMSTPPSSPLKNAMKGISDMIGAGTKATGLLTNKSTSGGLSGISDRVTRLGSGTLSRSSGFEQPREIPASSNNRAPAEGSQFGAEDRNVVIRKEGGGNGEAL